MESKSTATLIVALGAALYILFPGLILLPYLPPLQDFNGQDVLWALQNTILQSTLGGLGSIFLGGLGSLFLLRWSPEAWPSRLIQLALLTPSFLPPLFLILALLELIDPFPMGNIGLVIAHIFANAGVVSVLLARYTFSHLVHQAETAHLIGASRAMIVRRILWPQWKKPLAGLFFLVFVSAFTTFSLPLVLGGGKGTTLEVLIYERIRIDGDWTQAFWISVIQSSLFLLLIPLFRISAPMRSPAQPLPLKFLWSAWAGVFCLPSASLLASYICLLFESLQTVSVWPISASASIKLSLMSLLIGGTVGIFLLMALSFLGFCVLRFSSLSYFLRRLLAPSQAFVGLALILIFDSDAIGFWLALSVGLTYLFLPTMAKMNLIENAEQIRSLFIEGRRMGASSFQIFWGITLPLMWPSLCLLAALGSIWAAGDFALQKVVAVETFTLSQEIEGFLSTYRLHQAGALSLLWLFLLAMLFWLFTGVIHVVGQKLIQVLWRFSSPNTRTRAPR